jgi:uncharacterized protein YbbK (DUF523 family)
VAGGAFRRAGATTGRRGVIVRRPRVLISACLLGETVRYDGDHRRNAHVADELGLLFEWLPVCPEVEFGLGVPRETLRLEGDPARPRLRTTRTGLDHTEGMRAFARTRAEAALRAGISGSILKRGSPSCGVAGVRIWASADGASATPDPSNPWNDSRQSNDSNPSNLSALSNESTGTGSGLRSADSGAEEAEAVFVGMGLFAAALHELRPGLPMADEDMLADPAVARIFVDDVLAQSAFRV